MGLVSGPASGIVFEEHFNDLSLWTITNNDEATIHYDSASGFYYLHLSAIESNNRMMMSFTPWQGSLVGPSGAYENISVQYKIRLAEGHPWYKPTGNPTNSYGYLSLHTYNVLDGAEYNYWRYTNPYDVNSKTQWKSRNWDTLQTGFGGNLDGNPYWNSWESHSASGLIQPGKWNDVELRVRLNDNVQSGGGSYWSLKRLAPPDDAGHPTPVTYAARSNQWLKRGSDIKGFRAIRIGDINQFVIPEAQNYVDIAEIKVRNLDAPQAEPGGPYTINAGQKLYFDGSGTRTPNEAFSIDLNEVYFIWDFGDGSAKKAGYGLIGPTHIYTSGSVAGTTFDVELTTEYDGNQDIKRTTAVVTDPGGDSITANIGGPYFGIVEEPIYMSGSGSYVTGNNPSGALFTYRFGDGTPPASGLGLLATHHVYNASGIYNIELHLSKGTENDRDYSTATAYPAPSGGFPPGPPSGALIMRPLYIQDMAQGAQYIVENIPGDIYYYGNFGSYESKVQDLKDRGHTVYRYISGLRVHSAGAGWQPDYEWNHHMYWLCESNDLWLRDSSGNIVIYRYYNHPGDEQQMINWSLTEPNHRYDMAYNLNFLNRQEGPIIIDECFPGLRNWMLRDGIENGGTLTIDDLVDYNQTTYVSGLLDFINIVASGTSADPTYQDRHIIVNGSYTETTGWDLNYGKTTFFENADTQHYDYLQSTIPRWYTQPGCWLGLEQASTAPHMQQIADLWVSGVGGIIYLESNDLAEWFIDQRSEGRVINANVEAVEPTGYIYEEQLFSASGTIPPSGMNINQLFYAWEWGDNTPGTSGVGKVATYHTYYASGWYPVDVTVRFGGFSDTARASGQILDKFVFDLVGASGPTEYPLYFDATATTAPRPLYRNMYIWNFGDNTPQISGQAMTSIYHTYSASGLYTVSVSGHIIGLPSIAGHATAPAYVFETVSGVIDIDLDHNGPYFGATDTLITFSGDASYPSTNPGFNYVWHTGSSYQTPMGSGQIITYQWSDPGTYKVRLVASTEIEGIYLSASGYTLANVFQPGDVGLNGYDDFNRSNADDISTDGRPWVESEGNLRIINGKLRSDS